eukprot:RCo023624
MYGQITTCIYLKVSISDFLTLFSARTRSFFFTTKPSLILLCAGLTATSVSTALAVSWPRSDPDGVEVIGLARMQPKLMALWIWIYCLICWFIQDGCKVLALRLLVRYNVFDINNVAQSHDLPLSARAEAEEEVEPRGARQAHDVGSPAGRV